MNMLSGYTTQEELQVRMARSVIQGRPEGRVVGSLGRGEEIYGKGHQAVVQGNLVTNWSCVRNRWSPGRQINTVYGDPPHAHTVGSGCLLSSL